MNEGQEYEGDDRRTGAKCTPDTGVDLCPTGILDAATNVPLRLVRSNTPRHLAEVPNGVFLPTQPQLPCHPPRINACSDDRHLSTDGPTSPITVSKGSPTRIMDNPGFHDFLDSIPESDPTTLQSLLLAKSISEHTPPSQYDGHLDVHKTDRTVHSSPSDTTPSTLPSKGKRKLPSLQEMRNNNCILQLYGETTGRRNKRQKMKGRQCARCRLKNLKVCIS